MPRGWFLAPPVSAAPPAEPKVNYTTTDHLGSPRVITDANGQVISRRDFLPFGEELTINVGARTENLNYGGLDNIRQKFTGYQKDTETSLDFAEARMYENRFGRFTAVDPLLASGKSANPQTFNRFIYVGNNPLVRSDPFGLDWYFNGKKYEWFDNKPGDGGWNAVQFGVTGRYYYTGCRNEDCSETDRAVLKQAGGWDWSPVPLSIGFPGFSMPNPFAFADRIEGWRVGVPNFLKSIGNAPVETPIIFGTQTSLNDFGVPRFFEYGTYRNTTQRMAGFESQVMLTTLSVVLGRNGTLPQRGLTNRQLIQKAANLAEARIGGRGPVPGTFKHSYSGDLLN